MRKQVSQYLSILLHGKTFFSVRLGFQFQWTLVLAVDKKEIAFGVESKRTSICCMIFTSWMRKKEGVKAVGGRNAAQLDNRFNKVIKVDIVVFNKYVLQIHTEHPSGVPWILHRGPLSCERYHLEIEGKPYKFEHCVETLHKVPKYNPLLIRQEVLSSDDEAGGADRNRVNSVMGGTLERPQGRKAAKADAAARRRSKKSDDDEAETEAAAASRIADSFQSLTNSMVSGQEFDRMERAIKLLREQGRHALAERKTDELLSDCRQRMLKRLLL